MGERFDVSERQIGFQLPFRCILAGPTSVGKSSLLAAILRHRSRLFSHPFSRIIYCHSEDATSDKDKAYRDNLAAVCPPPLLSFCPGLPDVRAVSYEAGPKLLLLDDLMLDILDNPDIFRLITMASNHNDISVMVTSQVNSHQCSKVHNQFICNLLFLSRTCTKRANIPSLS
jgi:hypothetical protein